MQKLIVGNWKMYTTISDALVLAGHLRSSLRDISGAEVVLAPPTVWLPSVVGAWGSKLRNVSFGAQNVWSDDQGAYTGEVSVYMLKNMIKYAIVGHSERRNYAGESDELINEKVRSCLKWQVRPILCVGEDEQVLSNGSISSQYRWEKLVNQMINGLRGVARDRLDEVTIAYEPVWAIGTSNPATPEYAAEVITRLKERLSKEYDASSVQGVRWLYGGSVAASNAAEFLRFSEINGLLVGSASVKSKDFTRIVELSARS